MVKTGSVIYIEFYVGDGTRTILA